MGRSRRHSAAGPTIEQTSALARHFASSSSTPAGRLDRVLSDNGILFSRLVFRAPVCPTASVSQPDPVRSPSDQRARRTAAPHDPRRVLTARLRALPPSPCQWATTRPHALRARLQLRPRAPRTRHPRPTRRLFRLRCPLDGAEMSRACRPTGVLSLADRARSRTCSASAPARASSSSGSISRSAALAIALGRSSSRSAALRDVLEHGVGALVRAAPLQVAAEAARVDQPRRAAGSTMNGPSSCSWAR